MSDFMPTIAVTGEQVRGARAMLRLDQKEFAALVHLTLGRVQKMERTRGPIVAAEGVLKAMCSALEEAGIEFIDAGPYEGIGGPGVRLAGLPEVAAEIVDLETAAEEAVVDPRIIPKAS
jgi:transcriptional regulator with XRE-family HTH domain